MTVKNVPFLSVRRLAIAITYTLAIALFSHGLIFLCPLTLLVSATQPPAQIDWSTFSWDNAWLVYVVLLMIATGLYLHMWRDDNETAKCAKMRADHA